MEIFAENWTKFRNIIDDLTENLRDNSRYLFRGQSRQEWKLTTSFIRALPTGLNFEFAKNLEKAALDHFRSAAHLYLHQQISSEPVKMDVVGWWTLMQHYRAPTRMLDWTSSPYVACYFAVQGAQEADCAIWCLDSKSF